MKILAENRRANFDYETIEAHEAGLVLFGFEVKAIKSGHVNLLGAYVISKGNEFFLINALISPYQSANIPVDYDPNRSRKILLKKSEINSLIGKSKAKGLTLIPIRLYTKKNKIKLEFALARGKKKTDKRETIKRRDMEREIGRKLRG